MILLSQAYKGENKFREQVSEENEWNAWKGTKSLQTLKRGSNPVALKYIKKMRPSEYAQRVKCEVEVPIIYAINICSLFLQLC